MCELPPRSWRDLVSPSRVALGVAAMAAVGLGFAAGSRTASLTLLAFGAALFMAAVVLPGVQQLEFGFPAGFRIVTAVRDREAALRQAFEHQRPELELVVNLLCEDPVVAAKLLETAWGRAAASWRGPVTSGLHDYILCSFAHLLTAHDHWSPPRQAGDQPLSTIGQLNMLELTTRIVVVFHEFADVPLPRLSTMVGRSVEQMTLDIQAANAMLTPHVPVRAATQ